ncbi:MAG: peptidylprolyl isomerase [Bacteroidales bacterium]|jgi:peptidyl-prolyl cis-trans isomerase SurA|nr:peptidylprolyl isomerase [Bacteroidales bacterium]
MKIIAKNLLAGFICMISFVSYAQTDDPVVMKLGKENIKLSDFINTYSKNNDLKKTTSQELRDYIDLYVNFRLKYAEAEALRLDTIKVLQEELSLYRKQAAEKYLTDKEVSDKLVNEAEERMQWDIRASHLLKQVYLDALPADTLKAYNEVMKLRSRILKGEPFSAVAAAESDDRSAQDQKSAGGEIIRKGNGGDLGYFTVFDLIYSFETGAFKTPVGNISMPVRSEYGYHLIYVQDKKPALGKIKATQLFFPFNNNQNLTPSEKAQNAADVEKKAKEAYEELTKGMSLEDAAEKYLGSNEKPGNLHLFGCNKYEGDFINGFYGLKTGEISKPVKTAVGWHIVRIDEANPVVLDEQTRSYVKNRILRDSRSDKSRDAFIERVKKENNFKEAPADKKTKKTPLEDFYAVVDTSITAGTWTRDKAENLNKIMFTFAEKNYTQQDFANYLQDNQFRGAKDVDTKILVNLSYKQFVDYTVVAYEDALLEQKYPEFASLMKEYKEGILLYELNEQKVWKRAEIDTIGLNAYYQTIKQDYLYPVRLETEYFRSVDGTITAKAASMLKKGIPTEKLLAKLNKKNVNLLVDTVVFWQGQNKDFDATVDWSKIKEETVFVNTGENELARIKNVLPPSPKPLSEVKGMIVSLYQDVLEKQWIEDLHKNNSIWIDYTVILSILKK